VPLGLGGFPANELVAAWNVGQVSPAITASNVIGSLRIQIPPTAVQGNSYTVRFSYAYAAANLTTEYSFDTLPAKVWVQTAALTAPARVSDDWKINFFGSVNAASAQETADPDRDGLTNLQEYLAGTNPTQPDWRQGLSTDGFSLRWFATAGKNYTVLSST